ncbi:MAG TPA: hypothetical protein VIJ42_03605 [Stellaceae bacterium]
MISSDRLLGTWFIAVSAIWGEKIRGSLFQPKLKIALGSEIGQYSLQELQTPAHDTSSGIIRQVSARYFHVHVSNLSLFPAAQDVEVQLLSLETRGPDGQRQPYWSGILPLQWQYGLYQKGRNVGRSTEALADLFFVNEDGMLRLLPVLTPFNLGATMQGEQHFWLTVVARGQNGTSKPLRLRVDWNGKWERGDAEMSRHLRITSEDA